MRAPSIHRLSGWRRFHHSSVLAVLLWCLGAPLASAQSLPLFVDAFIDGQQVFCFHATSFRVGPMGSPILRFEWSCSTGEQFACYRLQSAPVPFLYFVTDRYIVLTCSTGVPPPPPLTTTVFKNGFELL